MRLYAILRDSLFPLLCGQIAATDIIICSCAPPPRYQRPKRVNADHNSNHVAFPNSARMAGSLRVRDT